MPNAISSRAASGEVALGMIVRMSRSGEIARVARGSGHDFIFIDGQHAAFSPETVAHLIQSAEGCGLAALVRVRSPEDKDASIWLDCGATGIIAPDLRSGEEARRFVDLCRFPPVGKRSFGGAAPQSDYARIDVSRDLPKLDSGTLCIAMIETVEALDDIDSIAATPGLDILHMGLVDLSIALDCPGDPSAEPVRRAVDAVAQATARHGKILGVGGDGDPARRRGYIAAGARFMTTDTDINLLLRAATERVRETREGA